MNQHFNYLMGLSFVMKYSWVLLNLHFSNHVYSAKERSWLEYDQLYGMPPTARIGHGFTIAAGKVFVFGGKTMNGFPNDFHQFDTAVRIWTDISDVVTGVPPTSRVYSGLSSINAKLYVFGGILTEFLNDIYEFDVDDLSWTNVTSTAAGPAPPGRALHGFCGSPNLGLYVFGGKASQTVLLGDLYHFDPSRLIWTNLTTPFYGTPPSPRAGHGLTAAGDALYVFGGGNSEGLLNDLHCYEPHASKWTQLTAASGSPPSPRIFFCFVAIPGRLIVIGGQTLPPSEVESKAVYQFNVGSYSWTDPDISLLSSPRYLAAAAGMGLGADSESVYIFGGINLNNGVVAGDTGTPLGGSCVATAGGRTYAFGGIDADGVISDNLIVFDHNTLIVASAPGGQRNAPLPESPRARIMCGLAIAGNLIYLFGGASSIDIRGEYPNVTGLYGDLHSYDLSTSMWTDLSAVVRPADISIPSFPAARGAMGFAQSNGKLFIFGGLGEDGYPFNDLFVLDTAALIVYDLTASTLGSAPSSRVGHLFANVGENIFMFGGQYTFQSNEFYNDLFIFDPSSMKWKDLSNATKGLLPSPRSVTGFAVSDDYIYVFGGYSKNGWINDFFRFNSKELSWQDFTEDIQGTPPLPRGLSIFGYGNGKIFMFGGFSSDQGSPVIIGDFKALHVPNLVPWTMNNGLSRFLNVYDWDRLEINGSLPGLISATLQTEIHLCTSFIPCQLVIHGSSNAILRFTKDGSIICTGQCMGLAIFSLNVECEGLTGGHGPVFKVQSGKLMLTNSTFSSCASDADGGVIQSYNGAIVIADSCQFKDLHTSGFGAAISAVGSNINVSRSSFINCSSQAGGGAIWVSIFQCFGSVGSVSTSVHLDHIHFEKCSTDKGGGAVMVTGDLLLTNMSVSLFVSFSKFMSCQAADEGGAIFSSGISVKTSVVGSIFSGCKSSKSGGAIFSVGGASLNLALVIFQDNSADGLGGGALHVQNSNVSFQDCTCAGNSARAGGGGCLYWQGAVSALSTIGEERSLASDSRLICGESNIALYGPCLASEYNRLLLLPPYSDRDNKLYCGLSFDLVAYKKDFYNQTILSDSDSVMQLSTSWAGRLQADPTVTISGSSVNRMQQGVVKFSVAIKPMYSAVMFQKGKTILQNQPFIRVLGNDLEQSPSFQMLSPAIPIELESDREVCPLGYVLRLDTEADEEPKGSGVCMFCPAGMYSVDPLAPMPGSNSKFPSCLQCPAGGTCLGGNSVSFALGKWVASNGMYALVSCPDGFQLTNSTDFTSKGVFSHDNQKCGPCLQGYYSDGPFQCISCPGGYYCSGGNIPRTPCPASYFGPFRAFDISQCYPAVILSVKFSLSLSKTDLKSNFSQVFMKSLASIAGLSSDRVSVIGTDQLRRSELGSSNSTSVLITVQIVCDNESMANYARVVISTKASVLSDLLSSQGLEQCMLTSSTIETAVHTDATPLSLIIGSAMGAFAVIIILLGAIYFGWKTVRKRVAHRAFIAAFRSAKVGENVVKDQLPWDLRGNYIPQKILGIGAFGCVVQAKRRDDSTLVAIKLVLPFKGVFDEREARCLIREKNVLEMFTVHECEHAVHLVGVGAVQIQPEVCWFVMELLQGKNMETIIYSLEDGPISDIECIRSARNVLAALKLMHSDGLIHRDIKPANIVRCHLGESLSFSYKLIDFGTAIGVDEAVAKESMMTLVSNRNAGVGTPPYMSPEMFKDPSKATYPTDLWSLGVTLFELACGELPFTSESDLLWSFEIAGNLESRAPSVLDKLNESRRPNFDHNLAKVISKALEKKISDRYQSVDEMHDAVYSCLINRGEADYSVFISYRVASEAPLAKLLFDNLNHTITPAGNRVTVYWDAFRLVKGENWEDGFTTGLLHSLCIFPILSYGSTAPLAMLPSSDNDFSGNRHFEERPVGRERLRGVESDSEDNFLKELLIAESLLARRWSKDGREMEKGMLQLAYPILVGRQRSPEEPGYPGMCSFFEVQGGGGKYPDHSSPPTNLAVATFLQEKACQPQEAVDRAVSRSVEEIMIGMTSIQGCQLWNHSSDLKGVDLSREQKALIGKGFTGPQALEAVRQEGVSRSAGFDEKQLQMLKAQVQAKQEDFHEIIDRAVHLRDERGRGSPVLCSNRGDSRERAVSSLVFQRASNGVQCEQDI